MLERHDDHWGGAAPWARVVRREMPNDSARLAALKAGRVDIIDYVASADYLSLERDDSIATFAGASAYVMNLRLDQR